MVLDPQNKSSDGTVKINLTPRHACGKFLAMVPAKIKNSPKFHPGAVLALAGISPSGLISTCLLQVNLVQMNQTAHSVSATETLQFIDCKLGCFGGLQYGLCQDSLSALRFNDELLTIKHRRTPLQEMRPRLAHDDRYQIAFPKQHFLGVHTHYFRRSLPHARPLKTILNVIGSLSGAQGEQLSPLESKINAVLRHPRRFPHPFTLSLFLPSRITLVNNFNSEAKN